MHIHLAKWQRGHGIGGTEQVVAAVVVDLVDILQQVELVGTKVGGVAEQGRHAHAAEAVGQVVVRVVPVEEVAGVIRAGAILAVDTRLERGLPLSEGEAVAVVGLQGEDMLVERGPLSRNVVFVEPHILVALLRVFVVKDILAAVGQPAVGIGVAGTPVKGLRTNGVAAGELCGVGGAAAVIVFGRPLIFRLRAEALAGGVSAVAELVEDVLPLKLVVPRRAEPGQVEHGTKAVVLVILVVGREAQGVHTVVVGVVSSIEVVDHVAIDPILVGVVEGSEQPELSAPHLPAVGIVGVELQVAERLVASHAPIVAKPVAEQVDHRVATTVEAERREGLFDAAVERAEARVEAEKIGGR